MRKFISVVAGKLDDEVIDWLVAQTADFYIACAYLQRGMLDNGSEKFTFRSICWSSRPK